MHNTKIAISAVAALTLGSVLVSGPAPAAAGQGLTQDLVSSVVLDKAITVDSVLHFCAFGTCAPEEPVTLGVVERLAVELSYDLTRASSLPNVLSTSGTLSFPDPADPDHRCDGREGVHLEVSGTSVGATRVTGRAKGEGAEQDVAHPAGAPAVPTGRVVLCLTPGVVDL